MAKSRVSTRSDLVALERLKRAQARPLLVPSNACYGVDGTTDGCRIDSIPPTVLPTQLAQDTEAKVDRVVSALRNYGAGLKAITDAKDRAALDGASAKLTGAMAPFLTVAGAAAPAVAAVPVLISAGLWLFGEALDAERLNVLRQSVTNAQQPVETLAGVVGAALRSAKEHRVQVLLATIEAQRMPMTAALTRDDWLARYDQLATMAAAQDAVQRVDPELLAKYLISAHTKLVEAANNPKINLAELEAKAKQFADQANKVRDAFTVLTK